MGVGDPQFIPAGHTDLIVAAIGEEIGFVGLAAVTVLFALLVWRLLRIALRAPGDYTAFLTVGLTLAFAVQALVIVGRHDGPAAAGGRCDALPQLRPLVDAQ